MRIIIITMCKRVEVMLTNGPTY